MRQADRFPGLDGRTADICCVISDILHQGRAKFSAMQAALNTANPLQELLKLGSISYPDRIATLKKALANAGPLFTGKTWKRASQDFVRPGLSCRAGRAFIRRGRSRRRSGCG